MACYTFHIFNREGTCQYYHEWSSSKQSREHPEKVQEDFKLMFGLCWSMKAFSAAVDPKSSTKQQMGAPSRIGDGCSFQTFKTNNYRLHFLESPSGLKFILCTAPNITNMAEHLRYIYANLYVDHITKNPLYNIGDVFLFESFTLALNKYMIALGLLN